MEAEKEDRILTGLARQAIRQAAAGVTIRPRSNTNPNRFDETVGIRAIKEQIAPGGFVAIGGPF